ncbi:MAG: sugar phosphate isomerase/epimerase [Clostridia bacterium]|nr:sugar phosphate isomerase/epimerase [Clostridia bacterium]
MKQCFSTLGCTERSLDEILALTVKFGMGALEVRGISNVLDNGSIPDFLPQNLSETAKKFADAGVIPLVLGTSCAFHDEKKYPAVWSEGTASVDIASRLGFRGIRVFGNKIKGEESACIRRVTDGILSLCDYAKDKGVDILLEVHGDFNTEERLRAVVDRCGCAENFGLIWDVCHTRETYGPRWREFYHTFSRYIRHVHLKDIKDGTLVLPGEGDLPLVEMVRTLQSEGYEGWFSLEWERKWHPDLPEIEAALKLFNDLFCATS